MADRVAPGLFAARGGGDAGHPVVEQRRQRQTDRQGGKVSTDPSRRSQLIFPPYGEFSFSKRKYSLFFLAYIFLSNARLLALVRQGNLPQVDLSR